MGTAGILGSSADMSAVRQAIETLDSGSIAGLIAGSIDTPQGRLTLTSGTPVLNASVASATTLYYTPYIGQSVPVYNGSSFVMMDTQGELSQSSTDATKSPAATVAASAYDIFVWNDNGLPRATRGPAWTNNTTRAIALTRLRGILVNSADITNGPPQYQGTYVGTVYTDGAAKYNWQFGSAAAGGGSSILKVWNAYNKKQFLSSVIDTSSYTYTTGTIRAAHTGNNFIEYVMGLAEDPPVFTYQQTVTSVALAAAVMQIGIGDSSTSAYDTMPASFQTQAAIAATATLNNFYAKNSVENFIGSAYAMALEKGDGANANTFNAGGNAILTGVFWA